MICITKSWLSPNVPNSSISAPGYVFRKAICGGGVCFYLDQKIPCKHLVSCDQADVESLWISMRPHSLPRQITSIVLAVIDHSTSNREPEMILQEHVQMNLDMLLSSQPNALDVFNPTTTLTTGLKAKEPTVTQVFAKRFSTNHRKENIIYTANREPVSLLISSHQLLCDHSRFNQQ